MTTQPRLTQTLARNALPGSVRFTCRDGEYRLTYTRGAIKAMHEGYLSTTEVYAAIESSAYYTCDLTDLMQTAARMHADYISAVNSQGVR